MVNGHRLLTESHNWRVVKYLGIWRHFFYSIIWIYFILIFLKTSFKDSPIVITFNK